MICLFIFLAVRPDRVLSLFFIVVFFEFMTIIVVWQLRVTLDSIRNSCKCFHICWWIMSESARALILVLVRPISMCHMSHMTCDMWCLTCDVTEKAIMLSFQKVPTRGLSDPLVLWKGLHGIGWSAGVHQKPALPLQLQLQLTKVQPKCTLRLSSTFFICDRWRQKDN